MRQKWEITAKYLMDTVENLMKFNEEALSNVRSNISMSRKILQAEINIGRTLNTLRTAFIAASQVTEDSKDIEDDKE